MKFSKKNIILIAILIVLISALIILGFILINHSNNSSNSTNELKDSDIKKIIKNLDGAYSICVVTEDNDPNGNLNKQGGYTGAVYFRLKQVDEKVKNEAIKNFGEEFVENGDWENNYDSFNNSCEAGTSSGGQIEIYPNKNDANKRNEYLSTLDGFLSGGYHVVKDTLVIRVSDESTSSQQKEIASEIIELISTEKK